MTRPNNQRLRQRTGSHWNARSRAPAVACMLAALLVGCAPLHAPGPAATGVSAAPGHEPAFMSRLAANNLYELEVSELAAARASSPRVRSLAQVLATHHVRARQQLGALMRSRGVAMPVELAPEQVGKLRRLQALPRSGDFDAAYVRVVGIEDHQSAIASLEQARGQTRDPALLSWIDRTLPVMRQDLQLAQRVAAGLAG